MSNSRQAAEGEATRRRMIEYIGAHQAKHGWAPTIREIGHELGISSPSTVLKHLRTLHDSGELVLGNGPRMIRLNNGHIELRPQPMPVSRLMVQDGRLQPGAR